MHGRRLCRLCAFLSVAVLEGHRALARVALQRRRVGLVAVGPAADAQGGGDGRFGDLRHDGRGIAVVVVGVALHARPDRVFAGVGGSGDIVLPVRLPEGRVFVDEVLQRAALDLAGHHQLLGLAVVHQGIRGHIAGLGRIDGHVQRRGFGVSIGRYP